MFRALCSVGIDIGYRSIKAVVLHAKKSQYELFAYAEVVLPTPIMDAQNIVDSDKLLLEIRKLRKLLPSSAKKVTLALSDSAVISKILPINPNLNDDDIEFELRQALSSSSPFPIEELQIDYCPMVKDKTEATLGTEQYQVVASRKVTIECRTLPLQSAGFIPKVVELKTHALLWVVQNATRQRLQQDLWGIVDVGMRQMEFCVNPSGGRAYHREISFGLQSSRYVQEQEGSDIHIFSPSEQQVSDFTRQLSEQLKRQLLTYQSSHANDVLSGLWLAGGGHQLIDEVLLSELLGVTISWVRPFEPLSTGKRLDDLSLADSFSQYALATGLALRGLDDDQ